MIKNPDIINSIHVTNKQEEKLVKKHPKFKPGKKPYCLVGKELLNGKVNWLMTLGEILATGNLTLSAIAREIGLQTDHLACVLENNIQYLTFNAGAKLLTIHERSVVATKIINE